MSTPPSTLEHLSAARLLPRPSSLQRWRPLRDCPRCIFCAAASKSDAFKKKARAASVHMTAFCILSLHPGQSLPHASARVRGQPPLPNKTVSPKSSSVHLAWTFLSVFHPDLSHTICSSSKAHNRRKLRNLITSQPIFHLLKEA